jgi:hypothetical protein
VIFWGLIIGKKKRKLQTAVNRDQLAPLLSCMKPCRNLKLALRSARGRGLWVAKLQVQVVVVEHVLALPRR